MVTRTRSSESRQQARAVWDRLLWGLADLRRALLARGLWLAPASTVTDVDGRLWRVDGTRAQALDSGAATGLLVQTTACLWGTLSLPQMPLGALDGSVNEALWRVSPLPLDQVACAWATRPASAGLDGWQADWGLCPNHVVQAALRQAGLPADAPIFMVRADGRVLAARGAAYPSDMRRQRRSDVVAVGILLLAALSLCVPAIMPLALKRQTVIRAMQHEAAAAQQAAPLREKLDALRRDTDTLAQLRDQAANSAPLASVVDALAAALPDDTWLNRLEVSNRQIRLTGLTGNATDLISRLGRNENFADVHTTAPTVRDDRDDKDRFAFEMRWRDDASAESAGDEQ